MPLIMRPPVKNNDDMLDAERLRQVARRKEQNRNAQRRLRERKEEYTMQLEAQLADLHRRSQSQEEESHFLREALARMRAENQTLAEQIAMIHQAVPSTQSSHPLPQRASIDLGVDHFAPLNRSRNRSQSATASMMPHFAFHHNAAAAAAAAAAPWTASSQQPMAGMHAPFGATIAPGATHRMPFSTASPLPDASSFSGGLTLPQHDSVEDVAMPRSDSVSRASSISPASQRRDSTIFSPFDLRANLSRHGSGQTELTLPGEHSEAEAGPATKMRRVSESDRVTTASMAGSASPTGDSDAIPSRTMAPTLASTASQSKTEVPDMPGGPDDVMASCLESIHSLPQANANTTQKTHFDNATSWISSNHDISGQLSLPDFRNTDMSAMSKPLGMTPGALGLTHTMPGSSVSGDGWTISPWINLAQTPSAGGTTAPDMENSASRSLTDSQALETGMSFDNRKSLASRRGFSGSLKLESRAT